MATTRRHAVKCSVSGCEKPYFAKGFCTGHYHRMWRHGDPLGYGGIQTPKGTPLAWLAAHVGYDGDDCLIWPFARTRDGYGQVQVDGKMVRVHRHLLMQISPPPSPKHEAAHNCGNGRRGCCDIRHLSWKTPKENSADKIRHGTINWGERHGKAKLTEADVFGIFDRSARGETGRSIADSYGVHPQTVSDILLRKRWTYLSRAELCGHTKPDQSKGAVS